MLFFFYRITNSIKRASKLCRCFFNTERMAQKRLIYHVFEPFPSPPKTRAEGSSPSAPATQALKNGLSKPFLRVFFFGLNPYLTSYTPVSNIFLTLFGVYIKFLLTPSNKLSNGSSNIFLTKNYFTDTILSITAATSSFCFRLTCE